MGEDARYITALLSAMVIRLVTVIFSVYLLLWVTSFVDTGILANEKEAALLYSSIAITAIIIATFFVPISGYVADKVSPRICIPVAFFSRAIIVFGFL